MIKQKSKNSMCSFMRDLSRLVLVTIVTLSLYILNFVNIMSQNPDFFLRAYTSVPDMLECILASVLVYAAFVLIMLRLGKNSGHNIY